MEKNKFSWRVFLSFALFYATFIIFISGVILYLAPAGRVANWVNWKLIGFSKDEWAAIHTIFSYVFVILAIFHLFSINWKAFWSYLISKTSNGINKKREFYISSIFTVVIFIGVMFSIPPFSSVMDLGEYLRETWEDKEQEAPIPHAELRSFNELATVIPNTTIEQISNRLNANKIKFDNLDQSLGEVAELNSKSPIEIYNIITQKGTLNMATTGIGKKTLEQFATDNNKDVAALLEILKANNINASKEQTLKDIASENDMAAKDIYELIK